MDPQQWTAQQCLDALRGYGIEAVRLRNDSRQVRPGDVFVAYPGERLDGRDFIAAAIANGAAAVLWERQDFEWPRAWPVANIGIAGLRELAGEIAALAAGEPARQLLMIGVTGTNGKTSCSHWIAAALSELGRRTAVIGTLGHGFPGALEGLANTTPDALALHRELLDRTSQRYVSPSHLALTAEAAGQHEEAMAFARRAWDEREPSFILWARHCPLYRPLHSDPRFAAILREMDSTEESDNRHA